VAEADRLLNYLHTLDYYTISFSHTSALSEKTAMYINKYLAGPVSERYKEALKAKLAM
jgi:hypothetical protein